MLVGAGVATAVSVFLVFVSALVLLEPMPIATASDIAWVGVVIGVVRTILFRRRTRVPVAFIAGFIIAYLLFVRINGELWAAGFFLQPKTVYVASMP